MPTPIPSDGLSTSDRSPRGQFAPGNPGGPGNPFARHSAALRQAMLSTITPQDMKEVTCALLIRAQAGDIPAIRLFYQYVVGLARPAYDPDTLDAHEMRNYL